MTCLLEAGIVVDEDPDEFEAPDRVRENHEPHREGRGQASPMGPRGTPRTRPRSGAAIDDTPALRAKNKRLEHERDERLRDREEPDDHQGFVQPSKTARLTMTGTAAATHAPA
jgi:hypothetical protein